MNTRCKIRLIRVQKIYSRFFSKSVSNPICPVKVQSKGKSNENPKEKIQKTNPCKDFEKNR